MAGAAEAKFKSAVHAVLQFFDRHVLHLIEKRIEFFIKAGIFQIFSEKRRRARIGKNIHAHGVALMFFQRSITEIAYDAVGHTPSILADAA